MRLPLFAMAVSICFLSAGLAQDTLFYQHIDRAKDCVFRVEREDSTFLGSAFTVNKYGHLLTCAHVVKCGNSLRDSVFLSGYIDVDLIPKSDKARATRRVRFSAAVAAVIPQLDIAVLRVDLERHGYTSSVFMGLEKSESLREGQEIAICAFIPDDFTLPKPFISKGIVSTIRPKCYYPNLKNAVELIQMDLNISRGTSGGPIFSVQSGRVVAILNGGLFESGRSLQTPYAIAMTISQVVSILDSLSIPYDIR